MGSVVDKGTGFLFHVNRYVAGSETDMYKHEYAELLYVSDGSLTEHVCGDKVHIKKGNVCFIDSGCVHKESFEEDDTFVIRLEVSDEIINAVISNVMADKQAVDYIKELVKVLKNSGYIHFGYKNDYDNDNLQNNISNVIKYIKSAKKLTVLGTQSPYAKENN